MNAIVVLSVNLVCSTFVFWVAARIYVVPKLPKVTPSTILVPILLLHGCRHLGLMFLSTGATYAGLPSEFAGPAAYGDFLAAILALTALPAVVTNHRLARPLVWVFNLEGSVDLIVAIVLATIYNAAPKMGPAYWIPAVWVPALLVTHYLTFVILIRYWPRRIH